MSTVIYNNVDVAGVEMDVKRFRVPQTLKTVCPKCGIAVYRNFMNYYLSYPRLGSQSITLYCNECDHEWPVSITLNVNITLTDAIDLSTKEEESKEKDNNSLDNRS